MRHISFEDALKVIEAGERVSLKYCSYDHKRKKGGELKVLEEGVITTPKGERKKGTEKQQGTQNHYDNFTRNFFVCINGEKTASIVKIHLNLILELNGKKVML